MTRKSATKGLDPNQIRFVNAYLADEKSSATKAYQSVYGVSKSVAAAAASRLLKRQDIKDYIEQQLSFQLQTAKVTSSKIIAHLAQVAFANIADVVDGQSSPLPMDKINRHDSYAIEQIKTKSISNDEGEVVIEREIKLKSSHSALMALAKVLALFKKDTLQSKPFKLPVGNYSEQAEAVKNALASGILGIEEGKAWMEIIDKSATITKVHEFDGRLKMLESMVDEENENDE